MYNGGEVLHPGGQEGPVGAEHAGLPRLAVTHVVRPADTPHVPGVRRVGRDQVKLEGSRGVSRKRGVKVKC